jgi:hypothetical protein
VAESGRRRDRGPKLGLFILFDAILFVLWIAIAWVAESIACYFQERGVHAYFALGFKWTSSGATFILALLYIIRDIIEELVPLFKRKQ